MKSSMILGAGLIATTTLVAASVAGCAGHMSSTTSSADPSTSAASTNAPSSSSSAQPADYTGLLIKASDIMLPGDTFTNPPPIPNPNGRPGVATVFTNHDDTREISDEIFILPDASAASAELDKSKAAQGDSIKGGNPAPAALGAAGTMLSGTTPDGSKALTQLLFIEGKAFINLEFLSDANDPVPPGFVTDVGQKQDVAVKNELPG